MEIEPLDLLDSADTSRSDTAKTPANLNTRVAITVAILATFVALCKVKDDNIVQAMEQAQARCVDAWGWYQSKKTRLETVKETRTLLHAEIDLNTQAPPQALTAMRQELSTLDTSLAKLETDIPAARQRAEQYQNTYDQLNVHDDQFDLCDALLALSISLLAMTSLTQKRWLYYATMIPIFFGVLYGIAGLLELSIHSDFSARLLGT